MKNTDRAEGGSNNHVGHALIALVLLLLLLWDALGLERWVMQQIGSAQGFALRHNFWLESGLHVGVQRVGAGRLGYGLARIGGYALPPQPKV